MRKFSWEDSSLSFIKFYLKGFSLVRYVKRFKSGGN